MTPEQMRAMALGARIFDQNRVANEEEAKNAQTLQALALLQADREKRAGKTQAQPLSQEPEPLLQRSSPVTSPYVEGASTPGPWSPQYAYSGLTHQDVASFGPFDQQATGEPPPPPPLGRSSPRRSGGVGGGSSAGGEEAESDPLSALLGGLTSTPDKEDTPEKKLNLAPILALVDSWTGSRLTQGYEDPNEKDDRRRTRLAQVKSLRENAQTSRVKAALDAVDKARDDKRRDRETNSLVSLRESQRVRNLRTPEPRDRGLTPSQTMSLKRRLLRDREFDLQDLADIHNRSEQDDVRKGIKESAKIATGSQLFHTLYKKAEEEAEANGLDVDHALDLTIQAYKNKLEEKLKADGKK